MSTDLTFVYSVVAAPGMDMTPICFAASTEGLQRSDDGGASWKPAWESLTLTGTLAATAIAISAAWVSDTTVFAAAPGGVFRSTDGGHTWTMALLPPPTPFISQLLISPAYAHDGMIFAGTVEDGVFRSGDRGITWEAWNIGLFDPQILCMAASPAIGSDRTLFVGTESGVFRSSNNGRFWHETTFGMDDAPVLSIAVSPTYADDGTLWAGTEARGLWSSTDRGGTWQQTTGLNISEPINALIVGAQPGHLLALLDDRTLETRDGGAAWHTRTTAESGVSYTSIAAPQGLDGAELLVGLSDGRVIRYNG